jgi:1-acyl-sn-glycerol-3-phosphate acyltransferase
VLHWSARWFLFATGQEVEVAGLEKLEADRPAVLVANHPGRLDALILAAALPETFLLSDSGALASLRLLEPLVVEPLTGNQAPPGGTQKQRIQRGLAAGHSVVVFPEGPRGEPAWRCRFRLDGFHAALETGAPVHPVAIRRANVTVGEAIQPEPENRREVIRLREAVREALGRLAQQKADA